MVNLTMENVFVYAARCCKVSMFFFKKPVLPFLLDVSVGWIDDRLLLRMTFVTPSFVASFEFSFLKGRTVQKQSTGRQADRRAPPTVRLFETFPSSLLWFMVKR